MRDETIHDSFPDLYPAVQLRETGLYEDARDWLYSFIEAEPSHAEAHSLLCQILLLKNDDIGAEHALNTALSLNCELPSTYRNHARLLLKKNKVLEALNKAEFVYKNYPHNLENSLVYSACLAANLQDLEASKILTQMLEERPDYAEAHVNKALISFRHKDIPAAIRHAKRAVSLKPHIVQMWTLLGTLYHQTGDRIAAISALKSGCEKDPENLELVLKLCELLRHEKSVQEALSFLGRASETAPRDPRVWLSIGTCFQQVGNLVKAKDAYDIALSLDPVSPAALANIGALSMEIGDWVNALPQLEKAITLNPLVPEAHNNLGITLQNLGKLHEATDSYRQAITLKPDFAEAYTNLGTALNDLRLFEDAEVSHKRAISIKPNFAKAHSNLGVTSQRLNNFRDAVQSYAKAIELDADSIVAKQNLCQSLRYTRFDSPMPELYPILLDILEKESSTAPRLIASGILGLLKKDSLIENLLNMNHKSMNFKDAQTVIKTLNKFHLLHHIMRVCSLPDLQFEKLVVNLRRILIVNNLELDDCNDTVYFLTSLVLLCFNNEYIFPESEEETASLKAIEDRIDSTLRKSLAPSPIELLCFASYRNLHTCIWASRLGPQDLSGELKRRLITEPELENAIAKDIPSLGEVSDEVSIRVKKQYEENPYPRWVRPQILQENKTIADLVRERDLALHDESIKNVDSPHILVAGCGTGQHSTAAATYYGNCSITAIDLSVSSLAYAKRKATELDISSIEYLRADILELNRLKKKFQIIECVGVLHHMRDPLKGWSVLVELLEPKGLLKIGLYSELARRNLKKIRDEVLNYKQTVTGKEVKKLRNELIESPDQLCHELSQIDDFYSLSEFRDLMLNVQEHHFTIPRIADSLDRFGLKFCGFSDRDIIFQFQDFFDTRANPYDLALWTEFEKEHPDTFIGMYNFWCQKI